MVGWYHQCNGYELGQTLGDSEGQEDLVCCSSWVAKLSTTWRLTNKTSGKDDFPLRNMYPQIVTRIIAEY